MSRRFFRLVCALFATLFVGEAVTGTVLALDGRYLTEFSENNILYYDPDWKDPSGCGSGTMGGCSLLGEMRTKMWNSASQEDKENFMFVVSHENGSLSGVEAYMNMVVARSDGDLHKWIEGLCPAFRGNNPKYPCKGSHKISKKEQQWIDKALAGSNITNFATGNASWFYSNGKEYDAGTGGPLACLWVSDSKNENGGACKDIDYSKKPFSSGGKCSEMIKAAGGDIKSGWECWGWDNTAKWSKDMSEKCGGSGGGGGGGEIIGDNKDYAGNQVWTDKELKRIEKFKPLYQKAAEEAGIPWEMLAAVHKRETNLSDVNPSDNDDGIFQQVEKSYPKGNKVTDEEFVEQATVTAKQLKSKMGNATDDDVIKFAFFAYNGQAKAYKTQARDLGFSEKQADNGEGSPYVMNKADEKRDPNKNPDGWGQIKHDHGGIEYPANQDYGAFVLYKALAGGGNVCLNGSDDISKVAIDASWKVGESGYGGKSPNDYLRKIAKEVGTGADFTACSDFAATVIRASGVDPDFPNGRASDQSKYMQDSDKWEEIPNTGDTSVLRSGDVLAIGHEERHSEYGHIKIYIEIDGKPYEAQASIHGHSGQLSEGVKLTTNGYNYHIYRAKG